MSVIPTVYNQGTGLIGSTTSGAAIPSNIDDLIVNDTLLVGGEATFNGAVTVNNSLTVSGGISFQDVTVRGTFILEGKTPTQLAFYTTGGELAGTADMTYSNGVTTLSNVTVVNDLLFGALEKTDDNYYNIALFDTNRVCVSGSPNTLRFQPSTGTITCRFGNVIGDFTVGASLKVTNGDLTVVSGDIDVENAGISCEEDITIRNGDLTMSNGTLTANAVTADFIRIQPLPDTNTSDNVPILFCDTGDNNTLKQDTEPIRLSYTPSLNKFFTGNAEINNELVVLGDATITNDLTVTTGTLTVPDLTVTNSASITGLVLNLTGTNAQREFDVVLKDRNSPFPFSKELDSTHLTYNPFYSRLTVFEINCSDKLVIEQQSSGTDNAELVCSPTGLNYDQLQGHFFQTNGNDKFRVKPGRVECVTSMYLNDVTVPGTSAAFPFLVHNPGTEQIKISDTANNVLYCDPVNGKITATTIEVTGNVDVNTDLQVDGSATIEDDITINSQTLVTANRNLNILLHENQTNDKRIKENNDFYYNPNAEELTVTNITVTGAIVNNLIPLNYTTVFSTRYSGSGTYGGNAWTMFNVTGAAGEDTEYTGGATGRLFGLQNQIMWPYTSAAGGAPTISQYGRDSTGTSYIDFGFGASSDSGDKFRLLSSQYQGWWYCEVNVFYQNTNGGSRDMPYIRLMKQVNGSGAYIEQPQVSQASEYLRYDSGEVSNLKLAGPIYFNNNTGTNFRIYTLLEQGNINNNPPPWNNESTNYLGLGLNISLRFLGKSAVGEQVTTL